MFYPILKFSCRILFRLLYLQIHINGKQLQRLKGPALIVANHPNSLLDALLIGTYCNRPVHFIVRSDMFNKPVIRTLLKWLNGIPVYRISEEKHRLRENANSFSYCRKILQEDGIILFFGEGMTVHDWKLKPMRSGLTRLLDVAMEDASLKTRLQIIPAAVNYSMYQCLLKTIHIDAGPALRDWHPEESETYAAWKKRFHQQMFNALAQYKYQMCAETKSARLWWKIIFSNSHQITKTIAAQAQFLHQMGAAIEKSHSQMHAPRHLHVYPFYPLNKDAKLNNQILLALLAIPTLCSLLLNGVPYLLIRWFCKTYLRKDIFYDSVLTVAIMIIMPLWWISFLLKGCLSQEPLFYWMALAAVVCGYLSLRGWKAFFTVWNYSKSNASFRNELKAVLEISNNPR